MIYPWQQHLDAKWNKYYYFNAFTNESVWELPEAIKQRVTLFYESLREQQEDKNKCNLKEYVKDLDTKQEESREVRGFDWMSRPARKQVETPISAKHAYKQGDEIYNIWYDKFLSDDKFKEREQAPTKIDVALDPGYTKADLYQRKQGYFCIHFARGCCVEGNKCRYYHHIPTLEECLQIDQVKDIFGRGRYSTHREDKEGVGNFMKETRTLRISDFCLAVGAEDQVAATYEILWRHFGSFGELEDIHLVTERCIAFVRYSHRCMAEFAKEAMANQPLESNEIMIVQWADKDIIGLDAQDQELDRMNAARGRKDEQDDTSDVSRIVNGRMRKKQRGPRDQDKYQEEKARILQEESVLMKRMTSNKEYSIVEQRIETVRRNAEAMDRVMKKLKVGSEPVPKKKLNYDSFVANLQMKKLS